MAKAITKTRGAFIVTRVSTGEQDKNGTSPETQLEACRVKAAHLGLPIIAELYDAGISGAFLLSRTGMQAALTGIKEGKGDTLICPNIARYSRDEEHQQSIKKAVRAAGGHLVFCDMDFADTPEGDLNFTIQGGFAAYERKVIRKRTMDGKQARAEEGIQTCRAWAPYGYHIPTKADVLRGLYPVDQLGRYQVVEQEARVVVRIFEAYTRGTHSLHGLARELTADGIPTPKGGTHWYPTSLHHILTKPTYTGRGAYGRHMCRADEGRLEQTHWRTGLPLTTARYQVDLPESEWTTIPATPIINQAMWDAAQERLATNRSLSGGNPKTVHMLSGRAVCPLCGGSVFRWTGPGRPPAFSCLNHRNKKQMQVEEFCVGTRYRVSVVEEATVTAILDARERPEAVNAAQAAYAEPMGRTNAQSDPRTELVALDKALVEIRAQEATTVQAQIAGIRAGASPDAYAEAFAQLAAHRKDLEDRRGIVKRLLHTESGPKKAALGIADTPEIWADVCRVLASPDVPGHKKRDALGLLVEKVICHKEGAVVVFLPSLFDSGGTVQSMSTRLMPSYRK